MLLTKLRNVFAFISIVTVFLIVCVIIFWPVTGVENAVVRFPKSSGVGILQAEVADTAYKRYVGLSNRDCINDNEAMVFAFWMTLPRIIVMRNMSFGVDIIFVNSDETVSSVVTAEKPVTRSDERKKYSGWAKYVIEAPEGYADEYEINQGDDVKIFFGDS